MMVRDPFTAKLNPRITISFTNQSGLQSQLKIAIRFGGTQKFVIGNGLTMTAGNNRTVLDPEPFSYSLPTP